ncbi:MAG: hypothetical protein QXZ44_01075 [Ferroplasma sp.]
MRTEKRYETASGENLGIHQHSFPFNHITEIQIYFKNYPFMAANDITATGSAEKVYR